ncbi:MAG: hypothetical protein V2J26_07220 [Pacificimonas sp.]|nr:hypothetical protein [Pacificimonas sp.]
MGKRGKSAHVVRRDADVVDSALNTGTVPQVRRRSKRNITQKQKDRFIAALAETCNVAMALKESGISNSHAYRLRQTDPVFAENWDAAKATALEQLEWHLLQRAIHGDEKAVPWQGKLGDKYTEYPDHLAKFLLTRHGGDAVAAGSRMGSLGRLNELRERREKVRVKLEAEIERIEAVARRGGGEEGE